LYKRTKITEEAQIKEFTTLYSSFFEEFKEIGLSQWLFYLLFILRRLALNLSYLFIASGVFQMSISLMFSLTVIVI
jgi:hypothetical protein